MTSRVVQKWNPQLYLRFGSQRLRPALDLLAQIDHSANPRRIADLGCGTGNITPFLCERWPKAEILCLDSSEEMLDRARANHLAAQGIADISKVDYQQTDFESVALDKPVDLIFSNAALHWVGFDVHRNLLPRLVSMLNTKGIIAFQIPDTRAQNSHLMMRQAMEDLGFDYHRVRWVTTEVDPDQYYNLLKPLCTQVDMWSSTFVHSMQGDNPVADFTASTGLGPYVESLGGSSTEEGKAFIAKYRQLINNSHPKQSDGTTLFSMKRFFLVAQKQ